MSRFAQLTIIFMIVTGILFVFACGDSGATKESGSSESSNKSSSVNGNKGNLLTSMIEKRQDFELVALSDGRLLSIGGRGVGERSGVSATDTTEVYDPAADKWTLSGRMSDIRSVTSAVELDDGTVLLAGGAASQRTSTYLTEIWDPSTGEWTIVADMNQAREKFGLIKLANG
ncbi:MAG: hypothetical protein FI698_01790, partial [SAR202 cluster bacterium]|nr:hypothetical protein [SAR202 cluster bacterium]